ncbi:MAG: ArsR family transcriptional regulator [Candidatus Dormibacteria bacterium]
MKTSASCLAPILRSDAQGRILAEVAADPDAEHTVTELAQHAQTSVPTASRELARAEMAGIVTSRRVGKTRFITANPANPLFRPLSELVLAYYGPPAVLREELERVAGVEMALIFGSWAARSAGHPGPSPHDIDVLVVGTPDRDAVYQAAEQAERRVGIPVQVTIRRPEQWRSGHDAFLREVRARPVAPICGNSHL